MPQTKNIKQHHQAKKAVIGFAGDSGDGVQVIGQQFTKASALVGNDIQTFPDFPAEIRAPSGTVAGVSGFQLQFASVGIHTPGDSLDTLIAFNPAALVSNISKLKPGGLIVVDQDKFTNKDFKKIGLDADPLEAIESKGYQVVRTPMTTLVFEALKDTDLSHAKQRKCKNFFALGITYWIYQRPLESTFEWLEQKFKGQDDLINANIAALKAGYHLAETLELMDAPIEVSQANLAKGQWRQITGNEALCLGAMMASKKIGKSLFMAGYPITPASDILHWFAKHGVKTFQAEDEMAAAGAALGASFGGALAMTSTSGPGMDLKAETIGLAAMTELPMVIVDVQRAGPSTGMPTKVEQSDLLMSMYGRHGACPLPVIAPSSPKDCFEVMVDAFSIAVKYMTPVIVLSDASIANGAEPWQVPSEQVTPMVFEKPNSDNFKPYQRDAETLARPWVCPGDKGFEHRIGGLEKEDITGDISYNPTNHQHMVNLRQKKIDQIANRYEALEIIGPEQGDCLVIGWGSTKGAILSAVESLSDKGQQVSYVHLRHLNPLPNELKTLLNNFSKVLCFELNDGQLCSLLRSKYLVDVQSITKVMGQPFSVNEVLTALEAHIGEPA